MKKDNITFKENIRDAQTLFINAGQILSKRGFVNAKYWAPDKIEKEYGSTKKELDQVFYVMYVNDVSAGAVVLQQQTEDKELWADYKTAKALYISKMCIVSPFRGKNYSKVFFDFCLDYAKENSCTYIRFDTCANSRAHCEYYKKCGFKEIATIHDGEENLCLFELVIQ